MKFTPRRIVRGVKARMRRPARRVAKSFGAGVHLDSESRRYWEERGQRYANESASILEPKDPYFQAQQHLLEKLFPSSIRTKA